MSFRTGAATISLQRIVTHSGFWLDHADRRAEYTIHDDDGRAEAATWSCEATAYLALHKGREAAAELQKFIDHRTIVGNYPLASLARLGLARAYVLQGSIVSGALSLCRIIDPMYHTSMWWKSRK
jgi:hypothetical protein